MNNFIEKYGMGSVIYISQTIGLEPEIIEMILEQGEVPISRDSKYYLECVNCGCSIQEGKYCTFCKRDIVGGIRELMYDDIAQRKKRYLNPEMSGKLHFKRK